MTRLYWRSSRIGRMTVPRGAHMGAVAALTISLLLGGVDGWRVARAQGPSAATSEARPTVATRPVVVASKPFGESYLLAEMFAQLLESRGIMVQRRPGLGSQIAELQVMFDRPGWGYWTAHALAFKCALISGLAFNARPSAELVSSA